MTVRGASSEAATGLDRYRLIRLLGRGGFGEVYLAHDSTLRREVAIKFVVPAHLGDDHARRQLLHDARAAAALDHQYICTVYEAGETTDGRGFIVMQYIDGEPLSDVLRRGAMPVRDALTLCSHVAEALAEAHHKGIIHRDLKPGNVMIAASGAPKLVDFGIATRMVASVAAAAAADTVTDSTISGPLIAGTPSYMSPEQVQHHPLDGRSDLFALGAVLFECLTGRRAFSGPSGLLTTSQVLHVHPPPPSTLNPEVTAAEDELCRRLLAKDPADRFQSANEVVGAIRLLLPDTSRTTDTPAPRKPRRWVRWVAAAAIVSTAGVAAVIWNRPSLPAAPPEAEKWYRQGTEAIREGAYDSARKALLQAVALYPQYALAYARLAEADAELDDARAAKDHLLQLSRLSPDEAGLPTAERLRLAAVRALVMRDVDASVQLYGQVLANNRDDPGAWLDLGRAQQTAGLQSAARQSYEGALARDRQYAAAYLRLGTLHGSESRHEEALAAFQEAERLYRARTDIEGETEVLLRRGALARIGEPKAARVDLERALALASDAKNLFQEVRATLALSSVTASEGRFAEAERTATEAVTRALASGLDTVAADGLIDLAATLMQRDHDDEAEQHAQRAISVAERQEARLTAARARIALASIYFETDRFKQSLAALAGVLPFLKENRYRRHELTAVSIAARSHQSLDDLDVARQMSSDVLATAEIVKDDVQIAIAAGNLASVMASLGRLPESLRLRQRAQEIHRRLGNHADLPYDLTNAADLLIRLGRNSEAEALLRELDAGIATRIDSYKGRAPRVAFLRAFEEATTLRCDPALRRLDGLVKTTLTGSAVVLAPALRAFCAAYLGRRISIGAVPFDKADPGQARETRYWLAVAALLSGNPTAALAEVRAGLALLEHVTNDELRWRLALVGAAAARRLGTIDRATEFAADADAATGRLRTAWQADFSRYERRPDLADLTRRLHAR